MKVRRCWRLGARALVVLAALVIVPAWAASSSQEDSPRDTHAAMHAACLAGDFQAMSQAMAIHPQAHGQSMGAHMAPEHHGAPAPLMRGCEGMTGR